MFALHRVYRFMRNLSALVSRFGIALADLPLGLHALDEGKLQRPQCILSGSTVCMAVLGEQAWEGCDLDVYAWCDVVCVCVCVCVSCLFEIE